MPQVEITDRAIRIDGKPTQIVSGAMHYFRIHPDLWEDRLDKAVAFGLNTVETYVCWNLHEPRPGEFDFSGRLDLERFIKLIHERGLYAMVRPGPYICSEWDNGGLPAFLMTEPGLEFRRMNGPYLAAAKRFYDELLPRLKPLTWPEGGPIIALQIENEYGSYCHDKEYLRWTRQCYLDCGFKVPLFTSDGAGGHFIIGGTIPECYQTVNFGSRTAEAFAAARKFRPDEGPDFCMEFWNGWFDNWGWKHNSRPAAEAASELETMLSNGASVNFYMFHGGTNFGFVNGANCHPGTPYVPTVTSYDYGAPLSECGDPGEKFELCQKVVAKYCPNPRIKAIRPTKKITPAPVALTAAAPLFANLDALSEVRNFATPPTMEALGQSFGFIHYRKRLEGPIENTPLRLINVNDFAQVWLDGVYLGSRMRDDGNKPFAVSVPKEGAVLDVLVENCGRTNYGPLLGRDYKGVAGAICVELQIQLDWEVRSLPLADLGNLSFGPMTENGPAFYRAQLELAETADSFLCRPGVKGVVWVNGFNLGRYWNVGPTETLYIPAPVWKKGRNEIVVFELEKLNATELRFSPVPNLG